MHSGHYVLIRRYLSLCRYRILQEYFNHTLHFLLSPHIPSISFQNTLYLSITWQFSPKLTYTFNGVAIEMQMDLFL